MVNPAIEDAQNLSPGRLIQLFDLDATSLGGSIFRFSNDVGAGGYIPWRGNNYLPLPIQADGFELVGRTSPNKPKLRVANVLNVLAAAMQTYGDLVGASLTRWRTFDKYVDNGTDPDPDRYLPVETYKVDRLVSNNKVFSEWELSTPLDAEGALLPARQVLREVCSHRYRYYESGAFVYTRVTCPYTGSNNFTNLDQPTADPSLDECSLTLRGCRLRFGQANALPISAFPSVARTRL